MFTHKTETYKTAQRRLRQIRKYADNLDVQALTEEEAAFAAIMDGNLPHLQDLLAQGLDVNCRTMRWIDQFCFHDTLLHVAIKVCQFEIANVLLDAGADPMAKDLDEQTPFALFRNADKSATKGADGRTYWPVAAYRLFRRLAYHFHVVEADQMRKDTGAVIHNPTIDLLIALGPDSMEDLHPGKTDGVRPLAA